MMPAYIMRWLPVLASLLLFVIFLLALFGGDPSRLSSALLGKPVPHFTLPALDDSGVGLRHNDLQSDLQIGRPVLLNVWGSWCAPCRTEHPFLMQLAAAGVPIFGLNYKDTPVAARRFLGALGNPYKKIGADRNGTTAIKLGVYGVPETFVLDGQGRVMARHAGPLDAHILRTQILPHLNITDFSADFNKGETQ